jgi:endonuclease/exonuclease/phosphatase family metal-dependent hydrolase
MNYNTLGIFDPGNYRIKKIMKTLKRWNKKGTAPDIVMFQEAFQERFKDHERMKRDSGYKYAVRGPGGRGLKMNSGLFILSNIELNITKETYRQMRYDHHDLIEGIARKGIQHVRLQIPGVPDTIDLYNTHMDAHSDYFSRKARSGQIGELIDFMAETRTPGTPAIVAGDFNFKEYGRSSRGRGGYDEFKKRTKMDNAWHAHRLLHTWTVGWEGGPGKGFSHYDHQWFVANWKGKVGIDPVGYARRFTSTHPETRRSDH